MELEDVAEHLTELRLITARREQALDLLCRCLVDLDTMSLRADVLLDRVLILQGSD